MKPELITKIEDVISRTLYLDKLPETAENGTMVVMEKSNQYFQFDGNEWVELKPYQLPFQISTRNPTR